MDFFVRKTGSQISVDDVLRCKFDHISNFLERYRCDAGGMRHKVPRAECLAAYYNSRPDEVFVLPLPAKVPLGTMFALRDADSRDPASQRFLRVARQDASGMLKLRVFEGTPTGGGATRVPQTDDDVLRGVGYEEVKMTPSGEAIGSKYSAFIALRGETPHWTLNFNDMKRVQDIEIYDPRRKYTSYRQFPVSKSWAHPWLDRGEFVETIEMLRRTSKDYCPKTSNAAFETMRARFSESQPRALAPLPRRGAMDSPELASILMDYVPPCTRAALAQTTSQFRHVAKEVIDRKARVLSRIFATRFSVQKVFSLRCAMLLLKAFREFRRTGARASCTAGLLPFETGYTICFKVISGVGDVDVLIADGKSATCVFETFDFFESGMFAGRLGNELPMFIGTVSGLLRNVSLQTELWNLAL